MARRSRRPWQAAGVNVPGEQLPDEAAGESADTAEDDAAEPLVDKERLDRIFGTLLPETTKDERDPGPHSDGRDRSWYEENRPPHHDR